MKKNLLFLAVACMTVLSCAEFDDSAIWDKLDNHEGRIEYLEELCAELNTNVSSIQTIINALQDNDYVTNVAPIIQGEETIGYTITFSKSGPVTIYNGADGADGKTPDVGFGMDSDGCYYWKLNGEWLLDENGNKIPMTGADGMEGVTPHFRVEDGYWYVSYDERLSWVKLDEAKGDDGDSFFESVLVNSENQTVTFYLTDGSSFVLPMGTSLAIAFDSMSDLTVSGETTIPLVVKSEYVAIYAEMKVGGSNSSLITKSGSELWKVRINTDPVSVTITPSETLEVGSSALLVVTLVDAKGVSHSIARVVVVGEKVTDENPEENPGENPGENPDDKDPDSEENLSSAGTANSYIVSSAGGYSFSTVKGNGSESVGEVASAEVLWETFGTNVKPNTGDLVSEVVYEAGRISFKASDKKGNALIAAKDAAGKILWSWHIWMTDAPADQVYMRNAGTVMDRNLGAVSADPGSVGALGLFYQWGRKDPFLGSSSISAGVQAMSTYSEEWKSESLSVEDDAIAYVIANPTVFIKYGVNTEDWYHTSSGSRDNTRWRSVKTIYDPCPVGYRVPNGGDNGLWATGFGTKKDIEDEIFNYGQKGFDFGKDAEFGKLFNDGSCWYPAAGYLSDGQYGSKNVVGGYGGYWSCTPDEDNVYVLCIDMGYIYPTLSVNRTSARSVRCVKE